MYRELRKYVGETCEIVFGKSDISSLVSLRVFRGNKYNLVHFIKQQNSKQQIN